MKISTIFKALRNLLALGVLLVLALIAWHYYDLFRENQVLKQIIERLTADSRIAEVVVTDSRSDPNTGLARTTIKFLEYDSKGAPLAPKYFCFSGNVIQFQSMVIRFDDYYVKHGDSLRGKSAYVFLKAFALGNNNAEVFTITEVNDVPAGYEVKDAANKYQQKIWRQFWAYATDPDMSRNAGIKNAQIEAPGTMFIPGLIYTIKIEHDGGMRIDAQRIPEILRGEKVLK